jgi:hypothetical protein
MQTDHVWTQEEDAILLAKYVNGMSCINLGRIFDVSKIDVQNRWSLLYNTSPTVVKSVMFASVKSIPDTNLISSSQAACIMLTTFKEHIDKLGQTKLFDTLYLAEYDTSTRLSIDTVLISIYSPSKGIFNIVICVDDLPEGGIKTLEILKESDVPWYLMRIAHLCVSVYQKNDPHHTNSKHRLIFARSVRIS